MKLKIGVPSRIDVQRLKVGVDTHVDPARFSWVYPYNVGPNGKPSGISFLMAATSPCTLYAYLNEDCKVPELKPLFEGSFFACAQVMRQLLVSAVSEHLSEKSVLSGMVGGMFDDLAGDYSVHGLLNPYSSLSMGSCSPMPGAEVGLCFENGREVYFANAAQVRVNDPGHIVSYFGSDPEYASSARKGYKIPVWGGDFLAELSNLRTVEDIKKYFGC